MASLKTTRPLNRQEAKLVTRHRLLQAAMTVLLEHGPEGLTTGSVTRIVGVAQPTFYVHFADMDELLRELATDIVERLRKSLHEARAPMRGSTDLVADSRAAFRLSVRATVKHADLLRLFLAEQYRPKSTLGACARQLLAELSEEMVADVAELPFVMGLTRAQLRLAADALVGLIMQLGLALADKRETNEDAVVELLASTTVALLASLPRG
jgi:TetR/AcrR family transcriptional regulator, fatty acid biosynthesis regulator